MNDDSPPVADTGRHDADTEGRTNGIDRRRYLKLAGGTAASLTVLGGAGVAAGAEYRTITVPEGQQYLKRLGSGESFENVLVDISAPGAQFKLVARGTGWTIRNVGAEGRIDVTDHTQVFNLAVDAGGSGLVENVYLGDGAVPGNYAPIFVPVGHAGTMTIRRLHTRGWPNNGLYASAPGRDARGGQNGAVRIESSYARNDNIDGQRVDRDRFSRPANHLRIQGVGDLSTYEFTVSESLQAGSVFDTDGTDAIAGRSAKGRVNGGTDSYAFDGAIEYLALAPNSVTLYLDGSEIDPGQFLLPHAITVSNRGYSEPATYWFSVSGDLQATNSVNSNDELSDSSAQGQVNGGSDTYRYSGDVIEFSNSGPLDVSIDGRAVYSSTD